MALVSDAGMPAISDPGARLVRAARDAGIDVTVLPGPRQSRRRSSRAASPTAVRFVGFLPRARRRARRRSGGSSTTGRGPRSPSSRRNGSPRHALARRAPPGAGGRRVPRADEEVRRGRRGSAAELAERIMEPPKGEMTLVLAPATGAADRAARAVAASRRGGHPPAGGRGCGRAADRGVAQRALPRHSVTTL